MLLDEKPLQDINLDDAERLIADSICESLRLDYKREWWGQNDEARREMLRDISSFANASGGYLVLGFETEKESGAGDLECPTSIIGLERSNYSEMVSRSCRDNLDPPCNGIDAAQIQVDENNVLVLVKVPQSLEAPHMVTFKGLNQFWKRHGTDKQPMSTQEIRDDIMSRVSHRDQIEKFAQDRIELLRAQHVAVMYFWAAPLVPLLTEIDVKDPDLRAALGPDLVNDPFRHNCQLYCGVPSPSLHGIEAEDRGGRLGLRSNGYLEFRTTRGTDVWNDTPIVPAGRFAIYLENLASLASRVFGVLATQGPVTIGCALLNMANHNLYIANYAPISESALDSSVIDLGNTMTYDLPADKASVVKGLNDRLWNAFHLEECLFYKSGELVLPR